MKVGLRIDFPNLDLTVNCTRRDKLAGGVEAHGGDPFNVPSERPPRVLFLSLAQRARNITQLHLAVAVCECECCTIRMPSNVARAPTTLNVMQNRPRVHIKYINTPAVTIAASEQTSGSVPRHYLRRRFNATKRVEFFVAGQLED